MYVCMCRLHVFPGVYKNYLFPPSNAIFSTRTNTRYSKEALKRRRKSVDRFIKNLPTFMRVFL